MIIHSLSEHPPVMQLQESPTAAFHTYSIHLLVTAYKFVVCRRNSRAG